MYKNKLPDFGIARYLICCCTYVHTRAQRMQQFFKTTKRINKFGHSLQFRVEPLRLTEMMLDCALCTRRTQCNVERNYILAAHCLIENEEMRFVRLSGGNYQSDFIDLFADGCRRSRIPSERCWRHSVLDQYPLAWVCVCVWASGKEQRRKRNAKKKKPFRCKIMQLHSRMHSRTHIRSP